MPAHKYTPQERIDIFWSKVDKSGDDDACWNWTAGKSSRGYGTFWDDVKTVSTHRYAYELTHGEIPRGLFVCHKCDNPLCCNPSHLWLGTALDNTIDRMKKGRSATGDKSGARKHPESRPYGTRNGKYTKPEKTPTGDNHGRTKWSDELVREIRRVFHRGGITRYALSKQYGIPWTTIDEIVKGKRQLAKRL